MRRAETSASKAGDLADEVLVDRLAAGSHDACAEIHRRYAGVVFGMAAQSLGASSAEEIVQEVVATVWRKAATYDRDRGPVRPWILRIAHTRILNELRRRSRRPAAPEPDGAGFDGLAGDSPPPDETAWREYRRQAVRRAVDALPPQQRQALRLAFFDELTHEQAAAFLGVPLGTAKTRIRAALLKLRPRLASYAVAFVAAATGAFATAQWSAERDAAALNGRALRLVTSSDVVPLRMTPAADDGSGLHATYRGRAGTPTAVVTLTHFPPAPAGRTYRAWARRGGRWAPLGVVAPGADGTGLLVVERDDVSVPPDALEVTMEASDRGDAPTVEPVVRWTKPDGR